jgi:hypothetical protein
VRTPRSHTQTAQHVHGTLDFSTRVLPVLTKLGCNSGTCHGAAVGQGGFKLSLLGYDPQADYESILRQYEGRRVNLAAPDESLLIRKPTMQTPHGGGLRFAHGSAPHQILRSWIAAGAPFGSERRHIVRIEVSPTDRLLPTPGQTQQLRVTALYSLGAPEDVTGLALYSSNDDAVATVTPAGKVTVHERGLTAVMVRYLGQVAAVRIGSRFSPANVSVPVTTNFIDRPLFAELSRLGLPPSPLAGDAEFLRRVFLDLTGTLPAPAEVRGFLREPPGPKKRQRVIEELLGRPEFVDLWTLRLADTLLINSKRMGEGPARAYQAWLREQVARNTPFDQVVRTLLTAQGDLVQNGAANFSRVATDPRDVGEFVSRTLLGVRVQCARCHHHPFDHWTQDDYYGLAAFFTQARDDGSRLVVGKGGEVQDPRTGRDVPPRFLDGRGAPAAIGDRRAALAAWLTSPRQRMLATATVNRVWKHLMGRGIIEPVDDVRVTNPPSQPALLQVLADDFVASHYDMRHMIRSIVSSRAYQLSSRTNRVNRRDERFFSHAYVKPLAAQVLADAIAQATGVPEQFPDQPAGTRATQLTDAQVPSYTLDVLGRCRRETSCDTPAQYGGGLPQALDLINGPAVNGKLRGGVVDRLLSEGRETGTVIEELYLRTLNRFPVARERSYWQKLLTAGSERRQGVEDLLWALLNSREFSFNH